MLLRLPVQLRRMRTVTKRRSKRNSGEHEESTTDLLEAVPEPPQVQTPKSQNSPISGTPVMRKLATCPLPTAPSSGEDGEERASLVPQEKGRQGLRKAKAGKLRANSISVVDRAKFEHHIKVAKKQNDVLALRAERKRNDMRKLVATVMGRRRSGGKEFGKPEKRKEMFLQAISDMRMALKTSARMMEFWNSRFDAWHADIIEKHGQEVLENLKDKISRLAKAEESISGDPAGHRRSVRFAGGLATESGRSFGSRRSLRNSMEAADVWELMKDDRVSRAFTDALSALNSRLETGPLGTTSSSVKAQVGAMKLLNMLKRDVGFPRDLSTRRAVNKNRLFRLEEKSKKRKTLGGGFHQDVLHKTLGIVNMNCDMKITSGAFAEQARLLGTMPSDPTKSKMRVLDMFLQAPIGSSGAAIRADGGMQVGNRSNCFRSGLHVRIQKRRKFININLGDMQPKVVNRRARTGMLTRQKRDETTRSRRMRKANAFDKNADMLIQPLELERMEEQEFESARMFNESGQRYQQLAQRRKLRHKMRVGQTTAGNVSMLKLFMSDVGKAQTGRHDDIVDQKDVMADAEALIIAPDAEGYKQQINAETTQSNHRKSTCLKKWQEIGGPANARSQSPESRSSSGLGDDDGAGDGVTTADDDMASVWKAADKKQIALKLLRSCKEKLIQRFGSVDKLFLKFTSAITGMTEEVFAQITARMNFSNQESARMFALLLALAPIASKRCRRPGLPVGLSLFSMSQDEATGRGHRRRTCVKATEALSRSGFSGAFSSITPVRNLAQLRVRLQRTYSNMELAYDACDAQHTGTVGAVRFRDFLVDLGVSALEACSLFRQMTDCNEHAPEEDAPAEISRSAFLVSLAMGESLVAACRLHKFLSWVVDSSASKAPDNATTSTPSGRRTSTEMTGVGGLCRRTSFEKTLVDSCRAAKEATGSPRSNRRSCEEMPAGGSPKRQNSKEKTAVGSLNPKASQDRHRFMASSDESLSVHKAGMDNNQMTATLSVEVPMGRASNAVATDTSFTEELSRSTSKETANRLSARGLRGSVRRHLEQPLSHMSSKDTASRLSASTSTCPHRGSSQCLNSSNVISTRKSESGISTVSLSAHLGVESEPMSQKLTTGRESPFLCPSSSKWASLVKLSTRVMTPKRHDEAADSSGAQGEEIDAAYGPSETSATGCASTVEEEKPTTMPSSLGTPRSRSASNETAQRVSASPLSQPKLSVMAHWLNLMNHDSTSKSDNATSTADGAKAPEFEVSSTLGAEAKAETRRHMRRYSTDNCPNRCVAREAPSVRRSSSKDSPLVPQRSSTEVERRSSLSGTFSSLISPSQQLYPSNYPNRRASSDRMLIMSVLTSDPQASVGYEAATTEAVNDDPFKKERAMVNVFINLSASNFTRTAPISLEAFRAAVQPLKLSPDEARMIYRLAGRTGTGHAVCIMDILLRVIGGLGHRHDRLRKEFGLAPIARREFGGRTAVPKAAARRSARRTRLNIGKPAKDVDVPFPSAGITAQGIGGIFGAGADADGRKKTRDQKTSPRTGGAGPVRGLSRVLVTKGDCGDPVGFGELCIGKRGSVLASTTRGEASSINVLPQVGGAGNSGKTSEGAGVSELGDDAVALADVTSGAEASAEDNDVSVAASPLHESRNDGWSSSGTGDDNGSDPGTSVPRSQDEQRLGERKKSKVGFAAESNDAGISSQERRPTKPVPRRNTSFEVGRSKSIADVPSSDSVDLSSPTARMLRVSLRKRSTVGKLDKLVDHLTTKQGGQAASPLSKNQRNVEGLTKVDVLKDVLTKSGDKGLVLDATEPARMESPPLPTNAKKPQRGLTFSAMRKQIQSIVSVASKRDKGGATASSSSGGNLLRVGTGANGSEDAAGAWEFQGEDASEVKTRSFVAEPLGVDLVLPREQLQARDYAREAELVEQRARSENELHQARLSLFNGDVVELQISTQKLQQFRTQVLARFKYPGKAFDELAGSRSATLTRECLQGKLMKMLRFNMLDAERVTTLAGSIEDAHKLGYSEFLRLLRFAAPTHTLLAFRTRLVQRYKTMDVAYRVLGLVDAKELSIDLFERSLLGAGIVSHDSHRLFRAIDRLQCNGPCGLLNLEEIMNALDNAHVVAWLEVLLARLGGRTGAQAALGSAMCLDTAGSLDVTLHSPSELESVLTYLTFPAEFVAPVFNLLWRRTKQNVTFASVVELLTKTLEDPCTASAKRGGHGVEPASRLVSEPSWGTGHSISMVCASEDRQRDLGLAMTIQLRRHIITIFANYQDAYSGFGAQRPADGITLDEWERAMETFGFADPERWALVFGHLIDWQHVRFNPKYRGNEVRVPLVKFAAAMNAAAPCGSIAALRGRLNEKCSGLANAWVQMVGKEGVDEIGLVQWQRAMTQFSVGVADATQLFVSLRCTPCVDHCADIQQLSHLAFKAAMREKAIEPNARLLEILQRLTNDYGVVSRAFEGYYPLEPLPLADFEEHLVLLLGLPGPTLRAIFAHLDTHQEGQITIDRLLDTLTTMQASYLPYADQSAHQNARKDYSIANSSADSPSPVSSSPLSPRTPMRSDAFRLMFSEVGGSNSTVGSRTKGCSSTDDIHNASTALPEDDSDLAGSSAESAAGARPHTANEAPQHVASKQVSRTLLLNDTRRPRESLFRGAPVGRIVGPNLAGWQQQHHQQEHRPVTAPEVLGGSSLYMRHKQGNRGPVPLSAALRSHVSNRHHRHGLEDLLEAEASSASDTEQQNALAINSAGGSPPSAHEPLPASDSLVISGNTPLCSPGRRSLLTYTQRSQAHGSIDSDIGRLQVANSIAGAQRIARANAARSRRHHGTTLVSMVATAPAGSGLLGGGVGGDALPFLTMGSGVGTVAPDGPRSPRKNTGGGIVGGSTLSTVVARAAAAAVTSGRGKRCSWTGLDPLAGMPMTSS